MLAPDKSLLRQDTTTVATVIPHITDHFKALDDGTPLLSPSQPKGINRTTAFSGMVRKCIRLRVPASVWQMLFHFLNQIRLSVGNRNL